MLTLFECAQFHPNPSAIFADFLTALGEYTGVYFDEYLGKCLCVYTFFISQEYQIVTIKRFATS